MTIVWIISLQILLLMDYATNARENTDITRFNADNIKFQVINKELLHVAKMLVVNQSQPTSETARPKLADGRVTVKGVFQYASPDFQYVGANPIMPIRLATVELIDGDTRQHIAWSSTLSDGSFTFDRDDNRKFITGPRNIVVKCYCENRDIVRVSPTKMQTSSDLIESMLGPSYFFETDIRKADGVLDMGQVTVTAANERRGAWNIYDRIIQENQWIKANTNPQANILQVGVYWPSSGWAYTSATPWLGTQIELGMGFEQDRRTIWHEYAHAVMYQIYGNRMPGYFVIGDRNHSVVSQANGSFALVEGWAEFFECSIDNYPNSKIITDNGYMGSDIKGNEVYYPAHASTNIETNNWWMGGDAVKSNDGNMTNPDNNSGNIVEGAVASILWDIFDSPQPDDDGLALGFDEVWTVIKEGKPNDMLEFWRGWTQRFGFVQQLGEIYRKNGINVIPSGGVIAIGKTKEDQISTAGQSNKYLFTITNGPKVVRVRMVSRDFPSRVWLGVSTSTKDSVIAQNAVSYVWQTADLSYRLANGTYSIWAGSSSGLSTGSYTLSLAAKDYVQRLAIGSASTDSLWGGWTRRYDFTVTNGPKVVRVRMVSRDFPSRVWLGVSTSTKDSVIAQNAVSYVWQTADLSYRLANGTYSIWAGSSSGLSTGSYTLSLTEDISSKIITAQEHPTIFAITQNYPNPFNSQTTINYELPETIHVRLKIYNINGQLIRILEDSIQQPGRYRIVWDSRDEMGHIAASGIYLYRLEAGTYGETKKMSLLK